nr:MAG TPA: hypothetical protein [Bacteriophage sp.]
MPVSVFFFRTSRISVVSFLSYRNPNLVTRMLIFYI